MSKPLILVTNDDGVHAKGIAALTEMVKPFGKIVVVAPEDGNSGMSHALTIKVPLRLRELEVGEHVSIYACNGTPADCVKLAMSTILKDSKPNLLVSGINHGSNSSISILYSGTLAAAAEGHLYGIPAIGFSLLNDSHSADFEGSIQYGRQIVKPLLRVGYKPNAYLNVNIPNLPMSEVKGIRLCRQAKGFYNETFERRADPSGGTYYWLTGSFVNEEPDAIDTDEYYLANGYLSVVPVQLDMTAYDELRKLKRVFKQRD